MLEYGDFVMYGDEAGDYFDSLIQAAERAESSGAMEDKKVLLRMAETFRSDSIRWLYEEYYIDPENYGLPTREEFWAWYSLQDHDIEWEEAEKWLFSNRKQRTKHLCKECGNIVIGWEEKANSTASTGDAES